MNTRWRGSCFGAVSCIQKTRYASRPLVLSRPSAGLYRRSYASPSKRSDDATVAERATLLTVEAKEHGDAINPPLSTLSPPLLLPTRGEENVVMYYYRMGRAYGSFYWRGIKAVWLNYQASKVLRGRLLAEAGTSSWSNVSRAAMLRLITRAEFQVLERNNRDIGKLPFFGLLVALFGEWLPLVVPFIPGAVPGTCRIPQQVRGMRSTAEQRRGISFRQGIKEPSKEQIVDAESETPDGDKLGKWPMVQKNYVSRMVGQLRDDQLHHLSSTLNLHNRLWDRIQLPPPSFLLRRGLSRRLAYLTTDDFLLIRHGGVPRLSTVEVSIACEERGIDVLGKREETLRDFLVGWLARQRDNEGHGSAILTMLFRRPNAWEPSSNNKKG